LKMERNEEMRKIAERLKEEQRRAQEEKVKG
jgi:hypothetical protein